MYVHMYLCVILFNLGFRENRDVLSFIFVNHKPLRLFCSVQYMKKILLFLTRTLR